MPKKKVDAVIGCLAYFRTAPLTAAKLALTLAADTVQQRMVAEGEIKPKPRKKAAKVPPSGEERP